MRPKNPLLKRANQELEYTVAHVNELKKCATDPIYFITKYVKIQHPIEGTIPFTLYPYQEKMIQAYEDNRFTVILSARQTGKALHVETPIPTPSGWTTMGEISVGDVVLGADGNPTTVSFVTETMHDHQCYNIEFSNGETIVADAEHQWEVNDTFIGRKVVKTTEKMLNDGNGPRPDNKTCRYSIDVTKPINLQTQQLEIDPYILGTWLGDGTSARGEFTVEQQDVSIYKTHHSLYETCDFRPTKAKPHILRVCIKELNAPLKELNVINNKHIPIKYLRANIEQRISLLQGLMDTDGTVDKTRGGCELTLTNDTLANDAYELICSLGLKPTLIKRKKSGFKTNSIIFTAYRDDFDVFRLSRKLKRQKQSPHSTRQSSTKRRSILSITPTKSVPVKCITVSNSNNLFLAGKGMIPTHNSTVSAAYLLWFAAFNPDKTVLIASRANSHAMEMIQRIRFAYEMLPDWLKPGVLDDGWNKHSIGFDNGSRILSEATSVNTGRGYSISLLYLDEFAFVPPNIQAEFWTSISPTLSTGGSCIMTSTPNGDMDIFSTIWRGANVGSNSFYPVRIHWNEPPGRGDKFKESETGQIGERRWKQEYECEFLSSEALLLDSIFLSQLTTEIQQVESKYVNPKGITFWDDIKTGATYLVGIDPATGSGEDFSVITLFHFPSMVQVGEYRSNTMSTNDLYEILKNLLNFLEKKMTTVYFSVENNGVGEGICALYMADEHPPQNSELVSESGRDKIGMVTTAKTKMKACVNLKEMLEKRMLHIKSPILLSELKAYIRKRGAYEAQNGSTDDCISATLIIIRILEEIAAYDQAAFDKLYIGHYEDWGDEAWDGWEGGYSETDEPLPIVF